MAPVSKRVNRSVSGKIEESGRMGHELSSFTLFFIVIWTFPFFPLVHPAGSVFGIDHVSGMTEP